MKLSIIIPCYKVEQYLDQCLESVTKNPTQDIEIILVDDGSPDRIPEMCDEWAKKDARIKVIHQENGGLSVARNSGLDASTGDYVWFIDSDDWITDDAIERVLSLIDNNPDVDDFVFPLKWTYEDSRKDWLDIKIDKDILITGLDYIKNYPPGATPRNILKRKVLDSANIRFCPGILHEDGLFGELIYNQSKRILLLKDYLYNYRQREGSIMHARTLNNAYSLVAIHKELMKYVQSYVPDSQKHSFRLRYLSFLKSSITVAWNLRHSVEFKEFLKNTEPYRIQECKRCVESEGLCMKIKCYLLSRHPIMYVYCVDGKKMFITSIKEGIKTVTKKLKLYDFLYNYIKRPNVK